jgi:hypothetical protein
MSRLLIFLVFVLLLGCVDKTESQTISTVTYSNYTDGQFSFQFPDWIDGDPKNETFLIKTNGTCVFGAARYPFASKPLKDRVEKEYNEKFSGEYVDYKIELGGDEYSARSRVVYCDHTTYMLTLACQDHLDNNSTLSSGKCAKKSINTKPKLGLISNPPNEDPTKIQETLRQSRVDGVDVLYWYFTWGDLDNNWTLSDFMMEPMNYEGKTAITMSIIHTNVLGKYPSKYSSFDEPGFKEDFANFSAEFARRYQPDYFFVGNEVDDYLWDHRNLTPAFKEILKETRKKVIDVSPTTKVGFTTTYHDALTHNATDIIKDLADEADIIGYTSYGYHGQFVFDNVTIGVNYLKDVKDVVPGKPYAITEAGWSSSSLLNSSEEKQKEFAEEFFTYLNTTDAEFVNWFALHDGVDCQKAAESFLTDMPEVKNNTKFMTPFKEYLCTLGIKKSDGTPKKAWDVWKANT